MDKALMEEIHNLVHHHLQQESYPTVEVEEDKEVKTVLLQTKGPGGSGGGGGSTASPSATEPGGSTDSVTTPSPWLRTFYSRFCWWHWTTCFW